MIIITINSYSQILGYETTLCQGDTLILDATTPNATYTWQDGSSNSTFTATQTGTYWVVIDTNSWVSNDTISLTFTPLPTVVANATNLNSCIGASVTLTGSGTNSYTWDQGVIDGVEFIPPSGTTSYTVWGTDAMGCVNNSSINVTREPVLANFSYTLSSGNILFTNTSTGGFNQSLWDFGDGNTSSISNPIHTYSTNGTFEVTLTVNDTTSDIACSDFTGSSISIVGEPIKANFSYTFDGNENYSFTNTSTGSFNQSHWAFGDGNTSTSTNPNHTFSANGTFVVTLTVNDSTSNITSFDYFTDTIHVTNVVNPVPCLSGFVMYPDTASENVIVVNSSVGDNLTYLWDFGDGTTSTQQFPSHSYATTGSFYLCLTVDNGIGCIDMYCDSIGENGVVFKQDELFTINVVSPTVVTSLDNILTSSLAIKIYPNSTSSQLSIDTKLEINEVMIFDMTGKMIMLTKPYANIVNIEDLSNGLYFIKFNAEEKIITKKFLKQ